MLNNTKMTFKKYVTIFIIMSNSNKENNLITTKTHQD